MKTGGPPQENQRRWAPGARGDASRSPLSEYAKASAFSSLIVSGRRAHRGLRGSANGVSAGGIDLKIIFYWVLYPLIRPFYLASLVVNTFVLASLIILISVVDRTGNVVHYVGKFWSLMNIYLSGTRLSIKGKEKIRRNGTYIVMSNHQSLFDVWALIGLLPLQLRWLVKSEIRKMPVFGYALERMGHIYVDRRKAKGITKSLEDAASRIRQGTSVVIFPEGTRSRDGTLQRFQRGGAVVAFAAGVPVLPVTVNGGRFVLPRGTLDLMPGKIQVVVGDEIDPEAFKGDRTALLSAVREAIEKNLDLRYGALISG